MSSSSCRITGISYSWPLSMGTRRPGSLVRVGDYSSMWLMFLNERVGDNVLTEIVSMQRFPIAETLSSKQCVPQGLSRLVSAQGMSQADLRSRPDRSLLVRRR
jgi:hypothetical protein